VAQTTHVQFDGGNLRQLPCKVTKSHAWRTATFIAALWLLNTMLTFYNVWPTVFIRPSHELSVELAVILLLMVAWLRLRNALPRRLLAVLSVLFVIGALGRYAEVTAPALYGREVNLYWDFPHVGAVTGMLTRVANPGLLIVITLGVAGGLALMYYAALWSWRGVASSLQLPLVRAVVSMAAIAVIGGFTLENLVQERPDVPRFAMPIAQTYGQQIAKVGQALMERDTPRQLPASPVLSSSLSRIAGSDVMVVFVESYGRVAYDNREFFQTLAPARAALDDAVRDTGRTVISGYVESPTFGGGSWLAHLNFLSGVEVRDYSRAQLLMTQPRRTLGNAFAEQGYRRVGLMPGLKLAWPEGVFYGFDQIYDDPSLGYEGPAFGWWRIPDQFSLAQLDALERAQAVGARAPLFVVFPTVSTHTPFRPTPPYQSDWSRMLSATPFDATPLQESLSQEPDWANMSASYKESVSYSLQTLAGYVRAQARDDLILVIIGDHQPPAMVTGTNAPWDVPVHIIASKPAVLEALKGCGFVSGVIPAPEVLGRMHQLGPSLLYSFQDSQGATSKCPLQPTRAAKADGVT
jgi:hypothetical protein